MYVRILKRDLHDIKSGDALSVETLNGKVDFRVAGSTKDALYGSEMIGMTRCLVNSQDYRKLNRVDKGVVYRMYAVLLVVSICLIVISLIILRFAIVFTMKEEFSEIGVMKAIGIKSRQIRGLYAMKYAELRGGMMCVTAVFPMV